MLGNPPGPPCRGARCLLVSFSSRPHGHTLHGPLSWKTLFSLTPPATRQLLGGGPWLLSHGGGTQQGTSGTQADRAKPWQSVWSVVVFAPVVLVSRVPVGPCFVCGVCCLTTCRKGPPPRSYAAASFTFGVSWLVGPPAGLLLAARAHCVWGAPRALLVTPCVSHALVQICYLRRSCINLKLQSCAKWWISFILFLLSLAHLSSRRCIGCML